MPLRASLSLPCAALAACAVAGTGSPGQDSADDGWPDCSLRTESWDDVPVTEGEIDAIMERYELAHRTDVTCEHVCVGMEDVYLYDSIQDVVACSLDLDATPGKASDHVVGTVDCVATVQNCHGD
jgi:hypothetical protein